MRVHAILCPPELWSESRLSWAGLPGGLGHFADGGIPLSQTAIFHPVLILATLLTCLQTALSAMPFVSDRRGVEVR